MMKFNYFILVLIVTNIIKIYVTAKSPDSNSLHRSPISPSNVSSNENSEAPSLPPKPSECLKNIYFHSLIIFSWFVPGSK